MTGGARLVLALTGLALWVLVFAAPLSALCRAGWEAAGFFQETFALAAGTVARAAALAAIAVLLGAVPGKILASLRRGRVVFFFLLVFPLLLPRYMLYYIWTIPLGPTTLLGDALGASAPEVARAVFHVVSCATLVCWYWPLAALIIAQGWRSIDGDVWWRARMEARPLARVFRVALPLLARPLACAFGATFVLLLTEYGTFHLAGIRTVGTELGVIFELTGSTGAVARASLPLALVAAVVAALLARRPDFLRAPEHGPRSALPRPSAAQWSFCAALLAIACVLPLALLAAGLRDLGAFGDVWTLHGEGLRNSAGAALLAAAVALAIAGGALALQGFGATGRALACALHATIFFMMCIPGALAGAGTLAALAWFPAWLGQGLWPIASGQAACFTGIALLMLHAYDRASFARVAALAELDGASAARTFLRVFLPLAWPLAAGAFLLVALLGLTELPATMMLLPPGVPNFTLRLLNQMHYARDVHVITACLALVLLYVVAAAGITALLRLRARHAAVSLCLAALCLGALGCDGAAASGAPEVLAVIGRTGDGEGEFLYPRAIDLDAEGNFFVADKTGRIQKLASDGRVLRTTRVPAIDAGKPTGLSVDPDGRLYVADTHYHRVLVYAADGTPERTFGSYGTGDGQFIYPTDVAFDDAGRVFVSEYGGNDRVSIFDAEGVFVRSFGKFGSAPGEFMRPAALAVDRARRLLYVADACNHRIVRCTLEGAVLGAMGGAGKEPGRFSYPYGITILSDGRLLVCEYGNNRLQVLDGEGRACACIGQGGRAPGFLAYPWAVAADARNRAFIVDAGNNRIQVWQL